MISGSTSIIVPNIRFLVTSGVVLLSDKIANATVIKIIRKIIGVYQEGLIIPIQKYRPRYRDVGPSGLVLRSLWT